MNRYDYPFIIGKLHRSECSHIGGGCICGYHDISVLVVSACCTDSGNYCAVKVVDDFSFSSCAACPFLGAALGTGFVQCFKDKVLVILLELVCNLCPELCHLLFGSFIGLVALCAAADVVILVVVVRVEDNVHIVLICVVNDFLDTLHPLLVNVAVLIGVPAP